MNKKSYIKLFIESFILIYGRVKLSYVSNKFSLTRREQENLINEIKKDGFNLIGHYLYKDNFTIDVEDSLEILFNDKVNILNKSIGLINLDDVRVIARAIHNSTAIDISYCGASTKNICNKLIFPTSIRKMNGKWQFVGYKEKSFERRDFILSRIQSVSNTNMEYDTSKCLDRDVLVNFTLDESLDAKQRISILNQFGNKLFVKMKESEVYYFKELYDSSNGLTPDKVIKITSVSPC